MSVVIGDAVGFGAGSLDPSEPFAPRGAFPAQLVAITRASPLARLSWNNHLYVTSVLGERGGERKTHGGRSLLRCLCPASLVHRVVTKPYHKTAYDLRRKQKAPRRELSLPHREREHKRQPPPLVPLTVILRVFKGKGGETVIALTQKLFSYMCVHPRKTLHEMDPTPKTDLHQNEHTIGACR